MLRHLSAFRCPASFIVVADRRHRFDDVPGRGATIAQGRAGRFSLARKSGKQKGAFAAISNWRADATIVLDEGIFVINRKALAAQAMRQSQPLVCGFREMAAAGCLLTYGPNLDADGYRAASYVDKILKGAKPADLPIEQPTKFEMVINLKTAKALVVMVPQSLLLQATR